MLISGSVKKLFAWGDRLGINLVLGELPATRLVHERVDHLRDTHDASQDDSSRTVVEAAGRGDGERAGKQGNRQ